VPVSKNSLLGVYCQMSYIRSLVSSGICSCQPNLCIHEKSAALTKIKSFCSSRFYLINVLLMHFCSRWMKPA